MSIQDPATKCHARIAEASGSQAVPDPMRVMEIPNGRSGIAGIGTRMTESVLVVLSCSPGWPSCWAWTLVELKMATQAVIAAQMRVRMVIS
jgi:hypothetical protein